jgi:hypothetical protein
VSLTTIVQYPRNAGIGVAILLLGLVVYQAWRKGALEQPDSSTSRDDSFAS